MEFVCLRAKARLGFAETDLLMIAGAGFDVKLLGEVGFEKFGLTTKAVRDVAVLVAKRGDVVTFVANRGDCDEKRSDETRVGAISLCRSRSEQDSEKLSSVKECDGDWRMRLAAFKKIIGLFLNLQTRYH